MRILKRLGAMLLAVTLAWGNLGIALPERALAATTVPAHNTIAFKVLFYQNTTDGRERVAFLQANKSYTAEVVTSQAISELTDFNLDVAFDTTLFTASNLKPGNCINNRDVGDYTRNTTTPGVYGVGFTITNFNGNDKIPIATISQNEVIFSFTVRVANGITSQANVGFETSGKGYFRKESEDGLTITTPEVDFKTESTHIDIVGSYEPAFNLEVGPDYPRIGSTVKVIVPDIKEGASVEYTFFKTLPGNTGTKYTIQNASANNEYVIKQSDLGYNIGVTVVGIEPGNIKGNGEHAWFSDPPNANSVVIKKEQLDQPPPGSIFIDKITESTITLRADPQSRYEWAATVCTCLNHSDLDAIPRPVGDIWSGSRSSVINKIERLAPETEYHVWSRYRETADTEAGPALPHTELVKTTSMVHQIEIILRGVNGSDIGESNAYSSFDGELVKDKTVSLQALPDEGYYFERWEAETPGITFTHSTSPNQNTFKMPVIDDKTKVKIVAYFGQKAEPKIAVLETDMIYGTPITDWYDKFKIALIDPIDDKHDLKQRVKLFYRGKYETMDKELIPTEDANGTKLDVGEYYITAVFSGSEKNKSVTSEPTLFTVYKADMPTPASHAIEKSPDGKVGGISSGKNSITIHNTLTGQMYLVYPYNTYKPSTELDLWRQGTGGDIVFEGLAAGEAFVVYTYVPESKNYYASDLASTQVSTEHDWRVSVKEGLKTCNTLSFYSKNGSADITPEKRTVSIINEGNGRLENVTVEFVSGSENFEIVGGSPGITISELTKKDIKDINKGTVTFEVKPKAKIAQGTYTGKLIIHAKQGESHESKSSREGDDIILGLPKEIDLIYEISDQDAVNIIGLEDNLGAVYNGQPHGIDETKVRVNKPADYHESGKKLTVYYYKDGVTYPDDDKNHSTYGTTQKPTDAGTYKVTVVPEAGYAGLDHAMLIINPKPLTIEGLSVKDKIYDAKHDAELINTDAKLVGVVTGDDVYIKDSDGNNEFPSIGSFVSKDQGTNIRVTLGNNNLKLMLDGNDADNYTLLQTELYGTIGKKPVTPIIQNITKTYDGFYTVPPNLIYYEFANGAIEKWAGDEDPVVRFEGVTAARKDVDTNIPINWALATMIVENSVQNKDNYLIELPKADNAMPTLTINPSQVTVNITGQSVVDYDGTQKQLYADYKTCNNEAQQVSVTYEGAGGVSKVAPTLAGRYIIDAVIEDKNYSKLAVNGVRELIIRAAQLFKTDVVRTVIPGDQTVRSVPLSSFNVSTATGYRAVNGEYKIETVIDDDKLLAANFPYIENGEIFFKTNTTAHPKEYYYGKFAEILVTFTPSANTFEPLNCYLLIEMADEGYTCTIINPPTSVKIGEPIDTTNMKLRTVYDSGKPADEEGFPPAMLSEDYDPNIRSEDYLGMKTIRASIPGTIRSASFNIMVLDVVEDFTVNPPQNLQYKYMTDKTLDLTGGYIAPVMRSGARAEYVELTPGMISITNSKLLEIGTHQVNVTYQGKTKANAFAIDVIPTEIGITEPPPGGGPGVINPGTDNEFTNEDGKVVDPVYVKFYIEELGPKHGNINHYNNALEAIKNDDFFKELSNSYYQIYEIYLKDSDGKIITGMKKPIELQINYPGDLTRQNIMKMLHVPGTRDPEHVDLTLGDSNITFFVQDFSPFVLGWLPLGAVDPGGSPSPSPGTTPGDDGGGGGGGGSGGSGGSAGGGGGASGGGGAATSGVSQSAMNFWNSVLEYIQTSPDGSVIRVNARSYDQMPVSIMSAMTKTKDKTLVITWNNGDDIVITSKTAFTPESTREYYPLSLLTDLFGTEPPKTDDPEEGEEWLREQRAEASASTRTGSTANVPSGNNGAAFRDAVNAYLANAIDNSDGNVFDIMAPDDEAAALEGITSAEQGWLTMPSDNVEGSEGVSRPALEPPTLNTPGIGTLFIVLGGVFAIVGAAIALYILRNRKEEFEVDEE